MVKLLELRAAHWDNWQRLLEHPVLRRLAEGSLSERSIYAWMEQDYRFVEGLLAFQAQLLTRAPSQHRLVLAHGLSAIVEDLDWMEFQPININAPPHPARQRYLEFLRTIAQEPYQVGATILWVLNRTFYDAWSTAAPQEKAFVNLIEHWTSAEFMAYMHDLGELAEAAFTTAGEAEKERIHSLVEEVIRLEWASWEMANILAKRYE